MYSLPPLQPNLTNRFLSKLIDKFKAKNLKSLNLNDNYDPQKLVGYIDSTTSSTFQWPNKNILETYKIQLIRKIKNDCDKYFLAVGLYYLETLLKLNQSLLADMIGKLLRNDIQFYQNQQIQEQQQNIAFIYALANLMSVIFVTQSPNQFSNNISCLLTNSISNNPEFAKLLISFTKSIMKHYTNKSDNFNITDLSNSFNIKITKIQKSESKSCTPTNSITQQIPEIYLLQSSDSFYIGYTDLHVNNYYLIPYQIQNNSLQSSYFQMNLSQLCSKCGSLCNQSQQLCGHNICEICLINLFTQDLGKNEQDFSAFQEISCQQCREALIAKDKIKFISIN